MNFRPLNDWALIQESYAPERTTGGIIIPDIAKEKPGEGIVLAIGPGRYKVPDAEAKARKAKRSDKKKKEFVPTTVLPGQRVLYMKYMTHELELDGVTYVLAREEHILGIFDEPIAPPASRGTRDLVAHPKERAQGASESVSSKRGSGAKKASVPGGARKAAATAPRPTESKKGGSASKSMASSERASAKVKGQKVAIKKSKKK